MATTKQLQAQLDALTQRLAQLGITLPIEEATRPEDRADYIAFGSPEHAAFLGLVEVEDAAKAEADGHIVHTSAETGKAYRLEDQVTPFMHYPDPLQVARLVLQQKVSAFESGPPQVPKDAPPIWEPIDFVPA